MDSRQILAVDGENQLFSFFSHKRKWTGKSTDAFKNSTLNEIISGRGSGGSAHENRLPLSTANILDDYDLIQHQEAGSLGRDWPQ